MEESQKPPTYDEIFPRLPGKEITLEEILAQHSKYN
jgi:hypothetical protein